MKMTKAILLGLGCLALAFGQDATPQRTTIPFSDPTADGAGIEDDGRRMAGRRAR